MFSIKKLFQRQQESDADEKFARFLQLHYRTYAKLCLFLDGPELLETNDEFGSACREWLPDLSKDTHRSICDAISKFHDAYAKRADALDKLMSALDRFREESPAEFAKIVLSGRGDIDASMTESQSDNVSVVDFKTKRRKAEPAAQAPNDNETCAYCGTSPGKQAAFLSGPAIAVCESSRCINQHDAMLRAEFTELRYARPLGRYYH